jgi:hypothetical protein
MIDVHALEAAKRWLARVEDDGSIAGYDETALYLDDSYDAIDVDEAA